MQLSIVEELKKGKIAPVYVLYGEEDYLIDQVLDELKKSVVHPDWQDLNRSVHDALKTPVEVCIEEAETFPFGEGMRLVVVKNAFFLTGNTIRGAVEHQLDALLNYLEQPADFSVLAIVAPYPKLDERKKLVKQLQKHAKIFQAQPFSADEWIKWITERSKAKGFSIDQAGYDYLLRHLPHDMRSVEQELEKLALYALSKKDRRITYEEMQQLLTRTIEGDIFTLVERVANRNIQEAYQIFHELMKKNEEPIKILTLIARQFRIILQVKGLSSRGYNQKQIATLLKLHPYPVKLAMEQGRAFPDQELVRILDLLAEADYQMKSGQIDKRMGLEIILAKIHS